MGNPEMKSDFRFFFIIYPQNAISYSGGLIFTFEESNVTQGFELPWGLGILPIAP